MRRPTVLHVARDWVRPSERFVADLVATTTATRAVVACGRRWPGVTDSLAVPVRPVGRLAGSDIDGHDPRHRRVIRAGLLAVAGSERAALLHAHFGYWAAHAGRTAHRLGRPWVLSLHGHDLLVEDPHHAERDVLRTADVVAVPSSFLADAASRAGFADEAIRVLPSGVDLAGLTFRERHPSADGRVSVTFAGRYVEKKGVLDAVAALAAVGRDHPELRVVFVGGGPLEAQLRKEIAAAGLAAELRDGGDPTAVRRALDETDLVVMPSRTAADGDAETLGLVAIEAQACGVPVVATRHGGLPEALSSAAAELVEEGDPQALAGALRRLLEQPERWPAMGRAGRTHVVTRYELGARTAAVEAAYADLLARRSPTFSEPAADPRPDVTVVMVTHNRRRLCGRSLDAIRNQTYPQLRVAVVDNASADGTADDLAAAAAADARVEVITCDRHQPAAAARNLAVAGARPGLVAFTDDDCFPVPTWVEALVAGFADSAEIGIVQGRTTADPTGWVRPLARTQWTPAEYGAYETANIAYRRELLGTAPFDERFAEEVAGVLGPWLGRYPFGEDTELAWRVKRSGVKSRFAATAVVHHHVHDPDPRYLLRRALIAAGFPLVVRRVPELRERMLWHRVLLSRRHAELLVALAGVTVVRRSPLSTSIAVAPYAVALLRPTRSGRRDRLRALPILVGRDLVELGALAYGSLRSRSLVL